MEFGLGSDEDHVPVLLERDSHGWTGTRVEGELWVARVGKEVVASLELVDLEEGRTVVDSLIVSEFRRGRGIGTGLMEAALSSREVEWWTECREELIPFYEQLGFSLMDRSELPADVLSWTDRANLPQRQHNFLRRVAP